MAAPSRSADPPAVALGAVHVQHGTGPAVIDALQGVDLSVATGSIVAVLGPSGSGKSTLARVAAVLDRPTRGTVHVAGIDVGAFDEHDRTVFRRRHVGVVLQHGALHAGFTVRENIELPLTLDGRDHDRAWFDELVTSLGIEQRLDHRPTELSGGQAARVAIARALVHRPALVVADEPTGNLDIGAAHAVVDHLISVTVRSGAALIVVTHDLAVAQRADRVIGLLDGRIAGDLHAPAWDDLVALAAAAGAPTPSI